MKLGSFLLGGVVGAAAAVYFSNRSKPMLWSAMMSADGFGGVVNKAKSKLGGAASRSSSKDFSGRSDEAHNEAAGADGLGAVQSIVNEDPALKAEVDAILSAESGENEGAHVQ